MCIHIYIWACSDVPGMPSVGGVKVSAHYCGPHVPEPDARPRGAGGAGEPADEATEAAATARVAAVVASNARLVGATCPHLEAAPLHSQSCLYTSTPDHDYLLDLLPAPNLPAGAARARAVLMGGGSGHAFKMGPALGDCAAALALGEVPPLDLRPFAMRRLLDRDVEGAPKGLRH